jgi:uncharacterized protein YegP (UPF0339 family)
MGKGTDMKFDVYQDRKKEWRWRLIAKNGRIVADSGEGYTRRASAFRALHRFSDSVFDASCAVTLQQAARADATA